MATRYVKKLTHPDGADFVLWHPTLEIYCPVMCDEAMPPHPRDLNLNLGPDTGFSAADMAEMQWRLTGEAYNSRTGESV